MTGPLAPTYPCCGHCTHGGLRWHWAPCPWCEEADA
jgi:hypothetical protein